MDYLGDSPDQVAANFILKEPSINKKKRLNKTQFARLDSVIYKVLELVNNYGFHILKNKQSPKSYSYYIRFVPTDSDGNEWPHVARIQFEVRDHGRNDKNDSGWVSDGLFVSVFRVGNKECFDTTTTILEVRRFLIN